jgi:hypothetical protein
VTETGSPTQINTADVLAIDDAVARATGSQGFGITERGFIAKPFARLLAEKLALARTLFGADLDLGSGSVVRKLLEVTALEDARTWAALSAAYDNQFVSSANGEALSRLGEELGITRPRLEARGTVHLKLGALPPDTTSSVTLPRGVRLLTPGHHHVALDETVTLSKSAAERDVAVVAFYPGPEHNLNPALRAADGSFPQRIDRWNDADPKLSNNDGSWGLLDCAEKAGKKPEEIVSILHSLPLSGGELTWPDARYRDLLLQAPRSLWTVDAVSAAVATIPGVRQVQVRDGWGGLDINQSIFGYFNFLERLFGSERNVATPYTFDIMVAPTEAALWDGPDGLEASILSAVEDLRPMGVFAVVKPASQVFIGLSGNLVVKGLPLPRGPKGMVINDSTAAVALKQRLLARAARTVNTLEFGEPVRVSEVIWAMMNEPGIADIQDLRLLRYPPSYGKAETTAAPNIRVFEKCAAGQNVQVQGTEIATFVDDYSQLVIV